MQRFKKKI